MGVHIVLQSLKMLEGDEEHQMLSIFNNITERERMEEARFETRRLLSSAILGVEEKGIADERP